MEGLEAVDIRGSLIKSEDMTSGMYGSINRRGCDEKLILCGGVLVKVGRGSQRKMCV